MVMRGGLRLAILVLAVGISPIASAQDRPDQCPGTYLGKDHPACPPPKTLAWVDCPLHWPGDPSKKIRYAQFYHDYLFSGGPDIERVNLDANPKGGQLSCDYGTDAELPYHNLIVEVPGPIIQFGWHGSGDGRNIGCRVAKDLAARSRVVHLVEPVTRKTTLAGFHPGMRKDDVRRKAAAEGYTVEESETGHLVLSRPDGRMELILNKAGRTREVIQFLDGRSNNEHNQALAIRFGLGWRTWPFEPGDPRREKWLKSVWPSPEGKLAVEFHPRTPFSDVPTLHLIDTAIRAK